MKKPRSHHKKPPALPAALAKSLGNDLSNLPLHAYREVVEELRDEMIDEVFAQAEEDEPARELRAAEQLAKALSSSRMTKTEICLRLAFHLLKGRLVKSNVSVALDGAEADRRNPQFPVQQFMKSHGCDRVQEGEQDWRDLYVVPTAEFAIVLHAKPGVGDLTTTLADGRRLLVEASAGPVAPTRSPIEHRVLRAAIGRALTTEDADRNDVIAAAVPRSQRFRKLAVQWRSAPRLMDSGLYIFTVDRASQVEGAPFKRE